MPKRFAVLTLLLCGCLHASSPTVYVGDRYEHLTAAVAADAAGNTYLAGSRVFKSTFSGYLSGPVQKPEVFVAKLNGSNELLWIEYLSGKESDRATSIAIDDDGSVYVAGDTTSPNFPLRNPVQSDPAGGFIAKLAADGSRVIWSTYYGTPSTHISSIALAPDGTLVIGGQRGLDSFLSTVAFVAKIDVTANKVAWEQEYGGSQLACTGGSSCWTSARLNGAQIAVAPDGSIYAAGNTNTLDLPTTAGVLLEHGYGPYVRKFSPAGALLWSTYLTHNAIGRGNPVSPADRITAVAATSHAVYLAGTGSPGWPTTAGSFQTEWPGSEWSDLAGGIPVPFAAKLDSLGKAFIYSTFLRQTGSEPTAVAIDAAGNAYVSSQRYQAPSPDQIIALNPSGSSLILDRAYPNGSRAAKIALDSGGRIHAAGAQALVTLEESTMPSSGIFGVANAAGTSIAGRIVPGELISIYGWNLGNEVYIGERPAYVLYTSDTQINAIAPFDLTVDERLKVSVRRKGADTGTAVVAVTTSQPEIFRSSGDFAAAVNADGTVNSQLNPARSGSVIALWGTGAAGWPATTVAGTLNPADPLTYLDINGIAVWPPELPEFAGSAPGMYAGVFQVNLVVPKVGGVATSAQIVVFSSSGEVSQPVLVWVQD